MYLYLKEKKLGLVVLLVVFSFRVLPYRRRMETEGYRLIASVWGAKFMQFLTAIAVLPRSIRRNRINSTISTKPTEAKQLVWQGIEQNLPPKQTRRPWPLLLSILLLWYYSNCTRTVTMFFISIFVRRDLHLLESEFGRRHTSSLYANR